MTWSVLSQHDNMADLISDLVSQLDGCVAMYKDGVEVRSIVAIKALVLDALENGFVLPPPEGAVVFDGVKGATKPATLLKVYAYGSRSYSGDQSFSLQGHFTIDYV